MQKVAVIGLGLIGSSIGMGLRGWSTANPADGAPALEVIGFDMNLDNQGMAKKIGAVDDTAWELGKAVRDADLVVIATPVVAMKETMENIAELLKPGAVVTDTGSTKTDVMRWAKELLPTTVSFVGSHPMAGSADGITGARSDLFQGATWVVTPSVTAREEAVRTVLGMITALGGEPYFVDPAEHDAYVAGVSHLPFVMSAALVNSVTSDPAWKDMKNLAASGFRDSTRLAGGSPEMHRDIVMTNKESVDRWLTSLIAELQDFQTTLRGDDDELATVIHDYFDRARDARIAWAVQTSREAELLDPAGTGNQDEGFSNQMSRMFLGGIFRKKRVPEGEKSSSSRN